MRSPLRVRRGDLRDVYVDGGRAAVFVNNQVIVLSEIATAILTAVPDGSTVSEVELAEALVAEFGHPEPPLQAGEVTHTNVLDLLAHLILVDEVPHDYEPYTAESVAAVRDALHHLATGASSTGWRLPTSVTAGQFVSAAHRHRVTPTIARALDRLGIPSQAAALLGAAASQEEAMVDRLSGELASILDALDRAGVRVLTFKGLALAVQAHADVAARGTGDHDLLVSPDDVERAYRALTSEGWEPDPAYPRPGGSWAWRHLLRDYYELPLVTGASAVDLHWHLGPAHTVFPGFEELWARRDHVTVRGREVATLSPYDALAHSCSHAAKDQWAWLRGLWDIHVLMSAADLWSAADRPLARDQLLSIGLAARMFGLPEGAPLVVTQAVRQAGAVWDGVLSRHASQPQLAEVVRLPGAHLLRTLTTLRRSGAGAGDVSRHLKVTLMPPWLMGDLTSTSVLSAVPRVLARRTTAVTRRWARALRPDDR